MHMVTRPDNHREVGQFPSQRRKNRFGCLGVVQSDHQGFALSIFAAATIPSCEVLSKKIGRRSFPGPLYIFGVEVDCNPPVSTLVEQSADHLADPPEPGNDEIRTRQTEATHHFPL
jgi:hypothetical protein